MNATTAKTPTPLAHVGIFQLLNGVFIVGALSCLARLGVPDLLERGPKSADELATAIGADPRTLSAHARHCQRGSAVGRPRWKVFRNTAFRGAAQQRESQLAGLRDHARQRLARTRVVAARLLRAHRKASHRSDLWH